jgi:hypothetical protein
MTMIDDDRLTKQQDTLALADLNRFRAGLYSCLTRRADAFFEASDAVLYTPSRVSDLARLSLQPVHRRGHGALYDAFNAGRIDTGRFSVLLAGLPVTRMPAPKDREQIVLAIDVSNWLRPDAATSPDRSFCHTYSRGQGQGVIIPGWRYSWIAALEPGATSWTGVLDVCRLGPGVDETMASAEQIRGVITRLHQAGQWKPGDLKILVVMDSGYDVTRLAWLLADLPVILVARVRSNRVFYAPAGQRKGPTKGRGPRHGHKLVLADQKTWPEPSQGLVSQTSRYGAAKTASFDRHHQRVERRGGWASHQGDLPIIEGTVIRLVVEHLPGDRVPDPVWLWCSTTGGDSDDIVHYQSMYLRRFDLEHTFRFCKQALGWTRPMLRDPNAADKWTWLIVAVYTQLRLSRPIVADHRLPWQPRLAATVLTPARVRAGFPRLHQIITHPANPPKASRPGPGRPPGGKNHHHAPIQPVGKKTKTEPVGILCR